MMTGAENTLKLGDREIELRFNFAALDKIEKQLGGKPLHGWLGNTDNLFKVSKIADIVTTSANAVKGQEKITKEFVLENLEGEMIADVMLLISFVLGGDEQRDAYRAELAKKEATEGDELDDTAPVEPAPL